VLLDVTTFVHSIGTCRMWRFLAVLRSFFHSSLLYTLSFHPSPPTSLPSSRHFIVPSISWCTSQPCFFQILFLGILFPSILCTCPNQSNLFNLIVFVIVGFFKQLYRFLYWLTSFNFLFHFDNMGANKYKYKYHTTCMTKHPKRL